MKINGQYPKLPTQEKNATQGAEKEVAKQAGISSNRAVANKSNFTVSKAREKIDATPDIDMDRVNALKSKIKNGEYQIDSLKLANRILKNSVLEDL